MHRVARVSEAPVGKPSPWPTFDGLSDKDALALAQKFWVAEMQTTVEQLFLDGKRSFWIPELDSEFKKLRKEAESRFQKEILIHPSEHYFFESRKVAARAGVYENGTAPLLSVAIPAWVDLHNTMSQSGIAEWRQAFQADLAVMLAHEVFHLAKGHTKAQMPSHEFLMDAECDAWGDTCKTFIPLLIRSKVLIEAGTSNAQDMWIKGGESTSSPFWREYIRKKCDPVHKQFVH